MATTIKLRRDTAANWTSANPTLAQGEAGVETDTGKIKYGDGSTAWTSLDYFAGEATAHDHDSDYAAASHDHDGDYADIAHVSDTGNPHSVTSAQAGALPEDAGIVSVTEAHTLQAGNAGKVHECDGTFTVTLPDGLDAGYQVSLVNVGSGTITLSAETTLQSAGSAVTLATQYEGCVVYHRGSNVWLAMGGLE